MSTDTFNDKTPYTLMFGPDECGHDTRHSSGSGLVRFILRHQNPVSGAWEEKHLKAAPKCAVHNPARTYLYTAIVGTDNTVRILVNNEEVTRVSMLAPGVFVPDINPAERIHDPNQFKPEDWVDEKSRWIDDPESTCPADWDEVYRPYLIPDPSAVKPAAWDEDAPLEVPDPAAIAPEDWEEDEDGEWEAPLVRNPQCAPPGGCGKWRPPMVKNPHYKGKWKAAKIQNPAYRGEWRADIVDNPHWFYDPQPHAMAPIGGVGIDLFTNVGFTMLDNIIVTHDPAAAAVAAKHWQFRHEHVEAIHNDPKTKAYIDYQLARSRSMGYKPPPAQVFDGSKLFNIKQFKDEDDFRKAKAASGQ